MSVIVKSLIVWLGLSLLLAWGWSRMKRRERWLEKTFLPPDGKKEE